MSLKGNEALTEATTTTPSIQFNSNQLNEMSKSWGCLWSKATWYLRCIQTHPKNWHPREIGTQISGCQLPSQRMTWSMFLFCFRFISFKFKTGFYPSLFADKIGNCPVTRLARLIDECLSNSILSLVN